MLLTESMVKEQRNKIKNGILLIIVFTVNYPPTPEVMGWAIR
jgi:hypothetical protein